MSNTAKTNLRFLAQFVVLLGILGFLFMISWNSFVHGVIGLQKATFLESLSAILLVFILNTATTRAAGTNHNSTK